MTSTNTYKKFLAFVLSVNILTACSDFIDKPDQAPQEIQTPVPSSQPVKNPPSKSVTEEEQKQLKACEEERQWAFGMNLIDKNQLSLYQNRNYAPVFLLPGERRSGIEGWYSCKQALELNGFTS